LDHFAAIRTFLRVAELERFCAPARQMGLPRARPLVAHLREGCAALGPMAPPQR
jgi:hypothetical protein